MNQHIIDCIKKDNSILSAMKIIEELELWDFIKTYTPPNNKGFTLDDNITVVKLCDCINDNYSGHTRISIAYTLRTIEHIAKKEPDIIEYLRQQKWVL
jgi:hypothetical protein